MRNYIDLVSDLQGNALFGASILVTNLVGGGNAAIFSDNGLTPITGSTVTTDITGQYNFFAPDGDYNLAISVNGSLFKTLSPMSIFDGAAQVTQADTGAVNAYATSSSVLEKQLRTGLRSWINIGNTNTGPSTYAYNGLTAKAIVAFDGSALTAGVLVTGGIYAMEYNGTAWQLTAAFLTSSSIGVQLYPPSQAELNAGLTISTANQKYDYYNLLRFGIVPNNNSGAVPANNTAAMQALVNAAIPSGPQGRFYAPNTTGADIYYFGVGAFQLRAGFRFDGQGVTFNFSGAFNTSMNTFGFFNLVQDASLENLNIVINYVSPQSGTGGAVNNGAAMRIGSRSGYGWGIYPTGIFDQDNLLANGLPLQGGITVRNLRIATNNPGTHIIFATGGLRNLNMDNIWGDGAGACLNNGFYYEYGWSSANGQPGNNAAWTSSHMMNSRFNDFYITNLATGGTSCGFSMNGADSSCAVDGIYVNTADQGLNMGSGEAFYFRMWAQNTVSPGRQMSLKNITTLNCPLGCALGGAGLASTGYLSATINALATPAKWQAQTDFMSYSLDGFSINTNGTGTAIVCSGSKVAIRNGTCNGGGVNVGAETMHFTMENTDILNAAGPIGLRFDNGPIIWSPQRPMYGIIRNNKICGSNGAGIAVGNCNGMIIENNQIGYNTLYDVAGETAQTNAVNIGPTSSGVRCRGNFSSVKAGSVGYQNTNTTANSNNSIENERNLAGLLAGSGVTGGGGQWLTDFQSPSAQVIATAGTVVLTNLRTVRLAPAAAVTGVILQAGQFDGQPAVLVNESAAASTITMAIVGTSRVADGVSCVIAGLTQKTFVWDSATNLWYHS